MKLLEQNIGARKLVVKRSLFGNERVFIDDKLVSQKRTFSGTTHRIEVEGKKYKVTYAVKGAWKKLTGRPVFQISAEGTLLSQHDIQNRSFLTIQFLIGLIVMYGIYLIITMIIESVQRGFVYHAY